MSSKTYLKTAEEVGIPEAIEYARTKWGREADVTVYCSARPKAIIELKKFTDEESLQKVLPDFDKVGRIGEICRVDAYRGVFVMDDYRGRAADERIEELSRQRNLEPVALSDLEA